MDTVLPKDWQPWRREPLLEGRRPTKTDLDAAITQQLTTQDLLPTRTTKTMRDAANADCRHQSSPWAAAANGPFGRPGNRFWPSLFEAGVTTHLINASAGISRTDERMLVERGGLTNIIAAPARVLMS